MMATGLEQHDPAREVSPALIIFGVAFGVRAIFLFQSLGSPYFGAPFLDEKYYYDWACRIGGGELAQSSAFFRAPLYAYLLGGLFAIFGPNYFVPRLVQHLLGSIAAVLVFKIGDRCFDRPTAWVAGLMAAVYPPVIFFEGEMLDISLQCFLYPALILAGLVSMRDPRWRWTILIGLLAGAGAIARPNVLLIVGAWLVLQIALASRWGGWRPAFARAGAIVGLMTIWMLPVLAHNVAADRSFVPISTYAGINFYIGNRLVANGYTASTPRRDETFGRYEDSVELFARRKAEEIAGRPLNGATIQKFWFKRAFGEIVFRPGRFVLLMLKKVVLFWNGYEIRNNKDLYFALKFTPTPDLVHRVWNFRVLAPLALLGMLLAAWRRRSAENLWLGLGIAAHMASVVLFFVSDRYRLPFAPLLAVFAAAAVTMLARMVAEREWRHAPAMAAAVVGVAALVNVPWVNMAPAVPHKDVWNVANCYMEKGQIDEALRWYQRFVKLNPNFPDGWHNLGRVYAETKQYRLALHCFEQAVRCDMREMRERQWSLPWTGIGYCRLRLGDAKGALAAYDEALVREAANRRAREGRAEALAALDRPDEALAELERVLLEDPNFVESLWLKATILARQGKSPEARAIAQRALALAPPAAAAEMRADPMMAKILQD